MAKLATTVALKGLSRSTFCAAPIKGSKAACHRLSGHKGECRGTTSSRGSKSPKVAEVVVEPNVTILEEVAAERRVADRTNGKLAKKAGKPKASPKVVAEA